MKEYLIYLCRNLINGKLYVGRTKNFKQRISAHIGNAKYKNRNKTYFHKSINKYGIKNFQWMILKNNLSEEQSKEKEIYYIKMYDAKAPNGMNLTIGGDGLTDPPDSVREKIRVGNKGKIRSKEARLRYSESHKGIVPWSKGKKFSAIHKNNMSKSQKGHPPTRLGMQATPETLHKRSLSMIGKNAKKIICVETGQIMSSLTKAAEIFNIDITSISKCAKGKRKTAGGYTWNYI